MRNAESIGAEDVARAAAEVAEHEQAAKVASFAFDVLSRQAEGQTLFAGKKHVETRAQEHGISEGDAQTRRGNLLEILTRGPATSAERALVAAFLVRGLGERLGGADDASTLTSFIRHADWLEAASPYAVYAFVDRVLTEDVSERVWDAVADACVGARPDAIDHGARASAALRVSALDASSSEAALGALKRIKGHAADPALRAAASFALGGDEAQVIGSGGERPTHIRGQQGRARGGPFRELLRIVTGWALAVWVLRLLMTLMGVERPVEATLAPGGIELKSRVTLLGRVVRERDEMVPMTGLARLSRDVRYPTLHLLVGLTALSLGVLIGGALTMDGARSGATWLLVLGASIIVAGAGLDLALDVLVPARRKRVAIELAPSAGRLCRIEGVKDQAADRFIDAVKAQI